MKALGFLAVLMVLLVVAGVATTPPTPDTHAESHALPAGMGGPPITPELIERWLLEPTHQDWFTIGDPGHDLCNENGPSERGIIKVFQIGMTEPADLTGLPDALEEHAPGVHLMGPYTASSATAAWRHSNPWTVSLVVTTHPLIIDNIEYAGFGCDGRAIMNPTLWPNSPCLWALALHEIGHAWGYEHTEQGIMRPNHLWCSEAEKGFIGIN